MITPLSAAAFVSNWKLVGLANLIVCVGDVIAYMCYFGYYERAGTPLRKP